MQQQVLFTMYAACESLGIALDHRVQNALSDYLDLLLHWNRRINLTAIRDPKDIVIKHFADSLAVAPHVPPSAQSLIDVGSGAGFPGAVIAIARPDLHVTLVEPQQKKSAFLRTLIRSLSLANARVYDHTVELLLQGPEFHPCDVAISRATWPVLQWLTLGSYLVCTPGGLVIAMEGKTRNPLPINCIRHEYRLGDHTRALVLCST